MPHPSRPANVGASVGAQASPGGTLAYRLWADMLHSQQAYNNQCKAQEQSTHAQDTLDRPQWEQAMQQGGAKFVDRGIKFTTREGVLKWVASNMNHIPVTATPPGDCRRRRDLRKLEANRRHWHF